MALVCIGISIMKLSSSKVSLLVSPIKVQLFRNELFTHPRRPLRVRCFGSAS